MHFSVDFFKYISENPLKNALKNLDLLRNLFESGF